MWYNDCFCNIKIQNSLGMRQHIIVFIYLIGTSDWFVNYIYYALNLCGWWWCMVEQGDIGSWVGIAGYRDHIKPQVKGFMWIHSPSVHVHWGHSMLCSCWLFCGLYCYWHCCIHCIIKQASFVRAGIWRYHHLISSLLIYFFCPKLFINQLSFCSILTSSVTF